MKQRITVKCAVVALLLGLFAGVANAQLPVTSGLQVWLDSSVGVTLDGTGTSVTGWADQSGNGNDAYATAGAEPTYVAADAGQNNLPTLSFDGTSSLLKFSSQVMPDNFSEMTIIAIAQETSGNGGSSIFNIRTGGGTPFTQLDTNSDDSVRFILRDSANRTLNAGGTMDVSGSTGIYLGLVSSGQTAYDSGTQGGTVTQTAVSQYGRGVGYVNIGSRDVTGLTESAYASTYFLGGNMADADYRIGGYGETPGWAGTISEILVYDRALGASERFEVMEYLSGKYAVNETLLDEQFTAGPVAGDWQTFIAGPGITEMPLDDSGFRHVRWNENGATTTGPGVAMALYTGATAGSESWENVKATGIIRVGGDGVQDITVGIAARVQDVDMVTGATGSFYGIGINPAADGRIGLFRQTGGVAGDTVWLDYFDSSFAGLAGYDLNTELTVSTTEDGNVQITGMLRRTDTAFAQLSFLDESDDRILGAGSVGFFGLNESTSGDFAAANFRCLDVYTTAGAITAVPEPSTIVLLLMAFGSLLIWRRSR